jgi:hypothetical protein
MNVMRHYSPEHRVMQLELKHAAAAIERAWLIARDGELEADLERLLEAARATLDLTQDAVTH